MGINIDDLKKENKKEPFIPTLKEEKEPFIPTIDQGPIDDPRPRNNRPVVKIVGGPDGITKPDYSRMKKLDLSQFGDEHHSDEAMQYQSDPQGARAKEIFKEGGLFDQHMKERENSFEKFREELIEEAEVSGKRVAELGSDGKLHDVTDKVFNKTNSNEELENINLEGFEDIMENEEKKEVHFVDAVADDIKWMEEQEKAKKEKEECIVDDIDDFGGDDEIPDEREIEEDNVEFVEADENPFEEKKEESVELDEVELREAEDVEDESSDEDAEKEEEEPSIGITEEDGINLNISTVDDVINDDEIEVSEKDVVDGMTDEEKRLSIKAKIAEKIKPITKKLNLQGYTIVKKGTTSNNIFEKTSKKIPVAKWVLPSTGITISMKEIRGNNIEKIRYNIANNNESEALRIIYDHITSPKAATFNAWLQSIAYSDRDHLYFAIYIASFADSNYLQIDCEKKCKEQIYVTDNIRMLDMVKFKNDKAKARFAKLYKESPSNAGSFPVQIVPVTENFAIGFKSPSLYSILVELNYLEPKFIQRYINTTQILPYIDNIYFIGDKQLIPVNWKEYANNNAKSLKSRIVRYDKVFDTMTTDELQAITEIIAHIDDPSTDISYKIPETTCPYCGAVKPESEITAFELVFRRYQLTAHTGT